MHRFLVGLMTIVLASISSSVSANDDCANAEPVSNGSIVSGTTSTATLDGSSDCDIGTAPDRWYRLTATEEVFLSVNTCGSALDSVVSIHTACPGTEANEVACNNDACDLQSQVSTIAAPGDYYIRVGGSFGASGAYTIEVTAVDPATVFGPDAAWTGCDEIRNFGESGGIRAYSMESKICNLGDVNLDWQSTVLGGSAYRVSNGRLEQIGTSWLKAGDSTGPADGCGLACNFHAGPILGVGCSDIYNASLNGAAVVLGKRSDVNPFTGAYSGASAGTGDPIISERLQILQTDLDTVGASYFFEGVVVTTDDPVWGNAGNNASYTAATVTSGTYDITPSGVMNEGLPAIYGWRDVQPTVAITPVDVPGEGRFFVGYDAIDLGGSWRYEYAIFNLNSDRSASSFTVPAGGVISGAGFNDVDYHSGEIYDNTDWAAIADAAGVSWASPQTFTENENTNSLRWGTTYSFWFESTAPPLTVPATLGLFKPGTPDSITVDVLAPTFVCGDGTCNGSETPCTCVADCGMPSVSETVCDDGLDDDCDGATDCADTDCSSEMFCSGSGSLPLDDALGTLLSIGRGTGDALDLTWGASCFAADDDFAVYEGLIGVPGSHTPRTCSTGGVSSWTINTPGNGNRYYLVVPRNVAFEGSHGRESSGSERPQGASPCETQMVACP